jgi:hypothetical protein
MNVKEEWHTWTRFMSQVRPQLKVIAELDIEASGFIRSGEFRAFLSECSLLWKSYAAWS